MSVERFMRFEQSGSSIFIPDGISEKAACKRTTHLGIGAHQDDLEFMAFHGILQGYQDAEKWFGGITCTNGSGCARTGVYADFSNKEMIQVRKKEQEAAAVIGQYSFVAQLDYSSDTIKKGCHEKLLSDLINFLLIIKPEIIYTHNPADKHDTHVGVMMAVINALRSIPPEAQPARVLGCEGWRNLDWMLDEDKVILNVSDSNELASRLNAVFESQIAGGKNYDFAVTGRRKSNATFLDPYTADKMEEVCFAMDLTPLIHEDTLNVTEYVENYLLRMMKDVRERLMHFTFP